MRVAEKIWRVRFPLMVLVLFQALDVLTTRLALTAGGIEGNPVAGALLGNGGDASLTVAKFAVMALAFGAVALDPGKDIYVPAAIIAGDVLYGLVIANNIFGYGYLTGTWALTVAVWGLLVAIAAIGVERTLQRRRATTVSFSA